MDERDERDAGDFGLGLFESGFAGMSILRQAQDERNGYGDERNGYTVGR